MNIILPLALGFTVSSLFVGLRYHQARQRRIALQNKRRLQGRSEGMAAGESQLSSQALPEHE